MITHPHPIINEVIQCFATMCEWRFHVEKQSESSVFIQFDEYTTKDVIPPSISFYVYYSTGVTVHVGIGYHINQLNHRWCLLPPEQAVIASIKRMRQYMDAKYVWKGHNL